MAGRQRNTRQAKSVEPVGESGTRQLRRSARHAEVSVEPETRPQPEIPQRGTRRRRRRSLESVSTNDFPESSASHASPEPENIGLTQVAESIETDAAANTDSVGESLDMDPERIQDLLDYDIPKLMRWCNKMYDVLPSMNSQQPNEHDLSKFRNASKGFNAAQVPFVTVKGYPLFIGFDGLPKDDPKIRAKIQAAICSGNLVSLLTCMVDVKLEMHQPQPVLDRLDAAFPALFNPEPTVDSNENKRTLDLAFRIRCRRLVELMSTNDQTKPIILAAQMFCTQNVRDVKGARAALNNGPYSKIGGIDLDTNIDYHAHYRSRIRELYSKLFSDDVGTLDEEYPQDGLFDDLRSWARGIYERLNRPSEPGNIRVAGSTPWRHASIEQGGAGNLFVDNNDEFGEDSDSDSDTDAGGYDRLPQQEASQNFINNSATLAAVRQSEIAATPPPDRQAAKGKGKALEIRDAIRALDPEQLLNRAQKRPRSSMDDGSEDDDFEVNQQLLDTSRSNHAVIQRPSPKRPRYSKQSSNQALSRMSATQRSIASEHARDGQSTEPNMMERDILVLSQSAQNTRRANIPSKTRQVRVPWTASETSRLLDLIADPSLKCSWSAMEEEGGFEHYRNQQALRDKARGLKVWYLEGDCVLPPGFDQIALGQKEKNSVIKCHRNPDRREDDLDEDGRIINNIWVE